MTPEKIPSGRLLSLDILRGLDLFLLLFLQPVVVAIARAYDCPCLDPLLHQLDHEVWEGFRLWDLVMPLFLFMTGAAMPFSFSKYAVKDCPRGPLYRRIARRVIILFIFGMIVQGNLLGLDPQHIYIYTNTLQAIAIGYLIAAIIMLCGGLRVRLLLTAALLAVYTAGMLLGGDWTREGNFAYTVDLLVIGRFRGDPTYTWIWSSLTFGVTVMTGAFAGEIMRGATDKRKATLKLLFCGIILTVAGLALSPIVPIIKRIWSTSMTLYSSGLCFLLMALFYWWIDCRGHSRGLRWLTVYGMNPITAYIIGEVINFRSIVVSLSYGLQPILGAYYPAWLTFGNALILLLILTYLYRRRIFLKV